MKNKSDIAVLPWKSSSLEDKLIALGFYETEYMLELAQPYSHDGIQGIPVESAYCTSDYDPYSDVAFLIVIGKHKVYDWFIATITASLQKELLGELTGTVTIEKKYVNQNGFFPERVSMIRTVLMLAANVLPQSPYRFKKGLPRWNSHK